MFNRNFNTSSVYLKLIVKSTWDAVTQTNTWHPFQIQLQTTEDSSTIDEYTPNSFSPDSSSFDTRTLIYFKSLPGEGDTKLKIYAKVLIFTEDESFTILINKEVVKGMALNNTSYFSPSTGTFNFFQIIYNEYLVYHWFEDSFSGSNYLGND